MFPWIDTDVSDLRRLWKAGHSASKISAHFGGRRSRNAVLSKLDRLGLLGDECRGQTAPASEMIHQLTELMCRWPIGHPGESNFRFCCAKVVRKGKPYCDRHCSVAYSKKEVAVA